MQNPTLSNIVIENGASYQCDFSRGELSHLTVDNRGRLRLEHRHSGYLPRGEFLSEVVNVQKSIQLSWRTQWTAPQRWQKHANNPVYGPHLSGAWDSWTNGVSIIPTDEDRRYRMYYAGMGGEGIGFAEASINEPTVWQEHPASPVLVPQKDNWEGGRINQPRVVKVTEAHWRMYCTGWGYDGPGTNWALGLAESFDGGTSWQRYQQDPILPRAVMQHRQMAPGLACPWCSDSRTAG